MRGQGGPCPPHLLPMASIRALRAWPGFRDSSLIGIMHGFFRDPCASEEAHTSNSLDRKMHLFSAPPQSLGTWRYPQQPPAEGPFPHWSHHAPDSPTCLVRMADILVHWKHPVFPVAPALLECRLPPVQTLHSDPPAECFLLFSF